MKQSAEKGFLGWVDSRFPLMSLWNDHLANYYAPKNLNWLSLFGSMALLILVNQIVSGIWLAMYYKPSTKEAFDSVEFIMRDVSWGWLLRYMHSTGASAFFIVVYLHMFRGLIYGSFKKPRELLWIFGMLIFFALMAEGFMGYLLPWGQMSYWGASVVISLFSAIPFVGDSLVTFIQGDYSIADATLNRFYSLHVVLIPLVMVMLVAAHIIALHEVGSNNPDGVEIKDHLDENGNPLDGVPFHPYYTVHDLVGVGIFLIIFSFIIFYIPNMFGHFLEDSNFTPANPVVTPSHIAPVWYFGAFYSILRSVTISIPSWMLVIGGVGSLALSGLFGLKLLKSKFGAFDKTMLLGGNGILFLAGGFFAVAGLMGGTITAKQLGVIAMFGAPLAMLLLPWLDRSPVKSIRYRGLSYKLFTALFVVCFLWLIYIGTAPITAFNKQMSVIWTIYYFVYFFVILPVLPLFEKTKPVPERVK